MRALSLIAVTLLLVSVAPSFAANITTAQGAASLVQSAGYPLVSKTEAASPGVWDVWASKDGIAYEVKVNAADGSLIAAVPVEDND